MHLIRLVSKILTFNVCCVPEHSIIPVSSECQHLFPAKVISGLTRWTMMSHQEFTVCLASHIDSLSELSANLVIFSDIQCLSVLVFLFNRSWASYSTCWRPVWCMRRICSSWQLWREEQVGLFTIDMSGLHCGLFWPEITYLDRKRPSDGHVN